MPRSVPSPSLSPFVSSSRRTLAQRLRARLGRRRGSGTQRVFTSTRARGTTPPAMVMRVASNSSKAPGDQQVDVLPATDTGPRSPRSASSCSVPGSSGSATAAPGASGAPPLSAVSTDELVRRAALDPWGSVEGDELRRRRSTDLPASDMHTDTTCPQAVVCAADPAGSEHLEDGVADGLSPDARQIRDTPERRESDDFGFEPWDDAA